MDLALNNLQRLICQKTQQTKPTKEEISTQPRFTIKSGKLPFNQWLINVAKWAVGPSSWNHLERI